MTTENTQEVPQSYPKYYDMLKKLEGKAELSSCGYLISIARLRSKSNQVLCISLGGSLTLGCVSVVIQIVPSLAQNLSVSIGIIIAFLAIGLSIFSLSDRIFGWNERITAYDFGFKVWKGYIRDSQWFRKNELMSLDEDTAKQRAEIIQQKYSSLVSSLPPNELSDFSTSPPSNLNLAPIILRQNRTYI